MLRSSVYAQAAEGDLNLVKRSSATITCILASLEAVLMAFCICLRVRERDRARERSREGGREGGRERGEGRRDTILKTARWKRKAMLNARTHRSGDTKV